jgi:nucleoside-diphosphate-sugar epimerase
MRQFLHADDCSACLDTLVQRYADVPRSTELHVTNFEWSSILDVAQIVTEIYPGTVVKPAAAVDAVQRDKRNEPDPSILDYWKPRIKLAEGVRLVNAGLFPDTPSRRVAGRADGG